MDGGAGHGPIVLIELVLVFGGVLLFGWWQLRSLERERRETARRRAAEARAAREGCDESAPLADAMADPTADAMAGAPGRADPAAEPGPAGPPPADGSRPPA